MESQRFLPLPFCTKEGYRSTTYHHRSESLKNLCLQRQFQDADPADRRLSIYIELTGCLLSYPYLPQTQEKPLFSAGSTSVPVLSAIIRSDFGAESIQQSSGGVGCVSLFSDDPSVPVSRRLAREGKGVDIGERNI